MAAVMQIHGGRGKRVMAAVMRIRMLWERIRQMERKKIIKVFGGFLAVMLAFTFLSRAVSGASTAQVETVRLKTGTIEHKVEGSGRVEAGQEVAVYTENGQRVKEICVQEGQSVEQGELLFTVDMDELEEQILAAQQEMEKASLQNEDAKSSKSVEQRNRALAKDRAAADYSQAVSDGDHSVAQAKAAWDAAEQELQEFLQQGPSAGQQLGSVQGEVTGGDAQSTEGNGLSWEEKKGQLEQAAAEAKAAYEIALSARTDSVKSAARALEDASMPAASDSTGRQNEITRQQQELALKKLQALKDAEGKITAPVRGVVTKIAITVGDFSTDGTAMRLSDTSKGSRLVATVDKANEKYVSKGSQANITPSGSKEQITNYPVSSVAVNEEDQTLLDVTIDLPEGVLEAGTMAEIEIVQKSENFSSVIPAQALREEQNGYYVLVAVQEQGVMGKELVARRFDVKVKDKNSTYAALEDGLLTGEQEVISKSSRTIGEGSRVRKKED